MKGRVYVVVEGEWASGDVGGCLLLDTGEVPWSHMSSSKTWLTRDLTIGFADRRAELERRYPDGYETVLIDTDGVIPDDVKARNAAWVSTGGADRKVSER